MPFGAKTAQTTEPLPFSSSSSGTSRFVDWCRQFLVTPKGQGAREPFVVHPFQEDMVAGVLDPARRRRNSLVIAPRGFGKSTLMAAVALYLSFESGEHEALIPLIGANETGSDRLLRVVKSIVTLSPEIEKRTIVYKDRVVVPATASEIISVAPTVNSIEGGDFAPIALIDEIGFLPADVFSSILLSTGKRAGSGVLAIGTPPTPSWAERSPLLPWWRACEGDEDPDTYLIAFVGDHCTSPACVECLKVAYGPALGRTIQLPDLIATMPPKVPEHEFQRARLCRFVSHTAESFISPDLWTPLANFDPVPDGSRVVIGLDGSFNGDATALTVATVAPAPHLFVGGLWERPSDATDAWTVPVLEVEDRIRELARRYEVAEIVCDPFRWTRTMQLLQAEGHTVSRFPWSPSRAGAAAGDFRAAVLSGEISHSGDPDLSRHVLNAIHTDKGIPTKPGKHSTRRIDLLAAAVQAHSRSTWLARKRRGRVASFSTKRRTAA